MRAFERVLNPSAYAKDLSNPIPVAGEKIIELRGDLDQTSGETAMTLVDGAIRSPIQAIKGGSPKKRRISSRKVGWFPFAKSR